MSANEFQNWEKFSISITSTGDTSEDSYVLTATRDWWVGSNPLSVRNSWLITYEALQRLPLSEVLSSLRAGQVNDANLESVNDDDN